MLTEKPPPLALSGCGVLPYTFKASPYSSHALVLKLLPERGEGRRVLDLGCGPGYLSSRLAARGFSVVAVDHLPPENLPGGVRFLSADLHACDPQVSGRFDFVLFADVLEHLLKPARLVAWALSHLEAAGRVVISVPNIAHLYVRLKLLVGNFDYASRGILDRTHLHFYTRKSFLAFLDECGLRCLELHVTPVPLELVVPENWQGPVFRGIHFLNACAARLFPRLLAYQFVCLATPSGAPGDSLPAAPRAEA